MTCVWLYKADYFPHSRFVPVPRHGIWWQSLSWSLCGRQGKLTVVLEPAGVVKMVQWLPSASR